MAEFGKLELRRAREARKWPRWQLGEAVGVSEDTITRWEDPGDKSLPDPDDVDRIEKALEMRGRIWHPWMLSHYDSYRERYASVQDFGLTAAILRIRHEAEKVMGLQGPAEEDVIDGRFDDPNLKSDYLRDLRRLHASIGQAMEYLGAPGSGG